MSKSRVPVTGSWQTAATGPVVVTIEVQGSGTLLLNETEDDTTAYRATSPAGHQFQQTSTVDTHVRATGDGWVVIVDGVL